MKKRFRRLFTGMLSAVMTLSAMPLATIHGENEVQKYPYTFFAGSSADGAITINANNVCINGNIATNGTIAASSANFNVNGTITENAAEPIVQCFAKIDNTYFDPTVVETYFEDYFREDTNINVNTPIEAEGDIELIGNINISSGLKALNDVNLSENVENTQNSAICSETGDIIIDTENVNLSGLVYAPNGNVNISAMNLNINGVVIIADTITIDCPSLNANYSASVGEFIGIANESEPETELYLITYGEYIPDTESIKVYWNTNVPQGTFDIQVSDDGESYTSVGTVTDEESYEYAITEPFSQKYIKVIETIDSGESYETAPIIVKNSDDGYDIEPLDSDEDGLPDFFELKIGTAIDNADTDNDGLTDYQEFVIVGTDPTIFDSAEEGTSDADYDSDGDGLSNIDEITRTTDPRDPDTDMDGLSDYDEIFVYNTDPLVADSDNDGIDDGSEIKFGLDPNSAATHGVPDGEYKMDQTIDTDNGILSSINTEESPYSLSVEMKTNGDMEKEISVVNSGYSNVIENDAMIGTSLDISMSDTCDPEDIVLKYDIKPEFTVNTLDKYSALPEFQGIKRLNVFKFNEEEGMLLPIETKFSDTGTQLYAEVDELGTYCVMDMEIWLDNLGVEMPENDMNISSLQARYPSNAKILADEKNSVNVPIDILFFLQTSGLSTSESEDEREKECFEKNKKLIEQLSSYLFTKYEETHIYLIAYGSQTASIIGNTYHTTKNSLSESLKSAKFEHYTKYEECSDRVAISNFMQKFICREQSDKFIFNFMNSTTMGVGYYDFIKDIQKNGYVFSQITIDQIYFGLQEDQKINALIKENNGVAISTSENSFSLLKQNIEDNLSEPLKIYNIILPTNWQTITLNAPLIKDGITDTDYDELTDWEEIDQTKVTIGENGKVIPPEFNIADLLSYTNRYKGIEYDLLLQKTISHIPYLPIISDPTQEDSDHDLIGDEEEIVIGLDPLSADTDKDTIMDGQEMLLGYDPFDPNPDGDEYRDDEEFIKGTDPFKQDIDFTVFDHIGAVTYGAIFGDYADEDIVNAEVIIGQIGGSFIPVVSVAADARDTVYNASSHHWLMTGLSVAGIVPVIGDASKAVGNVGEAIVKLGDDAPAIAKLIIEVAEKEPKLIKVFSKSNDVVEGIKKAVKSDSITKEALEKILKYADEAGISISKTSDLFKDGDNVIDGVKGVWTQGACKRGADIDEFLNSHLAGDGLGTNFPVFDRIEKETSTIISTKSLDLGAKSYKEPEKLRKRLQKYIDQMNNFEKKYPKVKDAKGMQWGKTELKSTQYTSKKLELVIPDMPMTTEQAQIIQEFIDKHKISVIIMKG